MTYEPPKKPAEPKLRYVVVTDAGEIEAIQRNGFADPIGGFMGGMWMAEANSLRQFRGLPVEFDV